MDARAFARGLRLRGLRALVVFHQGEIDLAVGHMARKMVAGLAGLGILEAEDLLVEVAGAQHVVDFQRDMDDTAHRWCSSMRNGVLDGATARKRAGTRGGSRRHQYFIFSPDCCE